MPENFSKEFFQLGKKKMKFYRIFRPDWKSGTHLMKTIINQATKFSKEKERTKMMLIECQLSRREEKRREEKRREGNDLHGDDFEFSLNFPLNRIVWKSRRFTAQVCKKSVILAKESEKLFKNTLVNVVKSFCILV